MTRPLSALFILASALICRAGTSEARSDKGARPEVDGHLQQGVQAVNDGRLEDGLAELIKAYEARPEPDRRAAIAGAYRDLGKPVEACREFEAYLSERQKAGLPPDRYSEAVRDHQCRLASNLGATIDLRSTPDGIAVLLDGTVIGKTPLAAPLRLTLGQHFIALDLPTPPPPAPVVPPAEPERRRGWVFAAGLGAGANFQLGDEIQGTQRPGGMLALQLGYQITPTWRLGIDIHPVLAIGDSTTGDFLADLHVALFPSRRHGYYLKVGGGIEGPAGIKAADTVNPMGILVDGGLGWEHLFSQHLTAGAEAWFGYTHFDLANVFNTALIATVGYRL